MSASTAHFRSSSLVDATTKAYVAAQARSSPSARSATAAGVDRSAGRS